MFLRVIPSVPRPNAQGVVVRAGPHHRIRVVRQTASRAENAPSLCSPVAIEPASPPLRSRDMRLSASGVQGLAFTGPTSGGGRRRPSRLAAVSSSSRRSAAHPTAAMAEAHDDRPVRMVGDVRDAPAGRENDLETIELARFAVAAHNSKTNAMLEFERLVKVRQQVVAGTMHYFTVEVREADGAKKLYEAKVWEKLWENFKQLQSFEPVRDAAAA